MTTINNIKNQKVLFSTDSANTVNYYVTLTN